MQVEFCFKAFPQQPIFTLIDRLPALQDHTAIPRGRLSAWVHVQYSMVGQENARLLLTDPISVKFPPKKNKVTSKETTNIRKESRSDFWLDNVGWLFDNCSCFSIVFLSTNCIKKLENQWNSNKNQPETFGTSYLFGFPWNSYVLSIKSIENETNPWKNKQKS